MKVERILKNTLIDQFNSGKAIVLIGPRQVGKSTLIGDILRQKDFLFLDGDDFSVQQQLSEPNKAYLLRLIGDKKLFLLTKLNESRILESPLKLL